MLRNGAFKLGMKFAIIKKREIKIIKLLGRSFETQIFKDYAMRSKNGFTLIEVMLTITIIGILSVIAIVSSQSMYSSYKIRGAARQIFSDIQMARVSAIKRGHLWCVVFSGSPFSSYAISDSGPDSICNNGDDILNKTMDLSSDFGGVTMTQNFTANVLNFSPNGSATNGTVILVSGSRNLQVAVNQNTGNVKIQ